MNQAAEAAALKLVEIPADSRLPVAGWWHKWVHHVGHKRLGRALLRYPQRSQVPKGARPNLKLSGTVRLTPGEMDSYEPWAAAELPELPVGAVTRMAEWWRTWYPKAGHRRLGRLLLAKHREPRSKRPGKTEGEETSLPSRAMESRGTVVVRSEGVLPCTFDSAEIDCSSPFVIQIQGGLLRIVLNRHHPVYSRLRPLVNGAKEKRSSDLALTATLLQAWAQFEFQAGQGLSGRRVEEARQEWGRALRQILSRTEPEPGA